MQFKAKIHKKSEINAGIPLNYTFAVDCYKIKTDS